MFRLDPETVRIFWRCEHYNNLPGDEVGNIKALGKGRRYHRVDIHNVDRLPRARIVFLLVRGFWSPWRIGHINGDSLDDRPANLYVLRRGTTVRRSGRNFPNLGK
ncbi:hypothetical protein [Aliiruegeria lutimaris]|uniref:HNH endonuclease n=1 Tax=Aliiruegeria lutimaris TaxID=571298 RepID=A0A1G9M8H5_9RHOB|nr:hypothetical protein [Aliiruegeria lutimaris]SDL70602.1 hypothetical protein SAMN04488026_110712 [Aliiruegeria lutimaris]